MEVSGRSDPDARRSRSVHTAPGRPIDLAPYRRRRQRRLLWRQVVQRCRVLRGVLLPSRGGAALSATPQEQTPS